MYPTHRDQIFASTNAHLYGGDVRNSGRSVLDENSVRIKIDAKLVMVAEHLHRLGAQSGSCLSLRKHPVYDNHDRVDPAFDAELISRDWIGFAHVGHKHAYRMENLSLRLHATGICT
jgi:hypothetical protein